MPNPVVYQGNLQALLKQWKDEKIQKLANGECARLPQELTHVGHTSRWQRGRECWTLRICSRARSSPTSRW
jgi:hypothetical protein